jgi:hypothetical protein
VRAFSIKMLAMIHENKWIKLRPSWRLLAHVTRRHRELHHLGDLSEGQSQIVVPPRDGLYQVPECVTRWGGLNEAAIAARAARSLSWPPV